MNHSKLHSVAHSLAQSLAGGISFVVPHHVLYTDVFAEAAATPDGVVTFDFLTGAVTGAYQGGELEHTAPLFKNAFPGFCAKNGVDPSDYRSCVVRFMAGTGGNSYVITVEDRNDRRTAREYVGWHGARATEKDALGRLRPKQIPLPEA